MLTFGKRGQQRKGPEVGVGLASLRLEQRSEREVAWGGELEM